MVTPINMINNATIECRVKLKALLQDLQQTCKRNKKHSRICEVHSDCKPKSLG